MVVFPWESFCFLVSFPAVLVFVLDHLSPPQRVYKQHCTVIPLSLIDLQTVIGKSGLVVVSECWALDGCHWNSALSLMPLFLYFSFNFYQPITFSKYLHLLHLLSFPSLSSHIFLLFLYPLLSLTHAQFSCYISSLLLILSFPALSLWPKAWQLQ